MDRWDALPINNEIKTIMKSTTLNDDIFDNSVKCYNIHFLIFMDALLDTNISGYANNEIVTMTHLAKCHKIYYNNTLINPHIENGFLNIDKLNADIIRKRKFKKNRFYSNTQIFVVKNPCDVFFARCMNKRENYDLFEKLPNVKIFSHNYQKEIWSKYHVGFQTYSSMILAQNGLLGYLNDDGTLEYSKDMIIPTKYFIRYQFIEEIPYDSTEISIDIKKELNSKYVIAVVGNINSNTSIDNLVLAVDELRNSQNTLNIVILVLSTQKPLISRPWIFYRKFPKRTYMNVLAQCNVCVNTWHCECVLYSGSNKNLDCLAAKIPLIIPYSYAYAEVFGIEYPYYYNSLSQNASKEIFDLLNSLLTDGFNHKYWDIKIFNQRILNKWNTQLNKLLQY